MINKLICFLFDHKKYDIKSLKDKDIITIKDCLNNKLVSINVCIRCGAVYSDLYDTGVL